MTSSMEMEMSKTYQYRKVMKPMLERKRRARINKCLDELKDLMVATLESEGEHVTRLEKADILELTVSHLMKLKQQKKLNGNTALSPNEAFRSGYIYAANEVSRTLSKIPGVNISLGTKLMTHLGQRLNQIHQPIPIKVPAVSVTHPLTVQCGGYSTTSSPAYSVPLSPISSFSGSPRMDVTGKQTDLIRCQSDAEENVWRPW